MLAALAWGLLALATLPALLLLANLPLYATPRRPRQAPAAPVSVLIPARDEERAIGAAVEAALATRGVEVEVVVLDDGSTDRTAQIVRDLAQRDGRVRLIAGPPLPAGWNGKQHACARLAEAARHRWLLFQDADVTLRPEALLRLQARAERRRVDLLSGVPHQITVTVAERLVIPLIHFVLLGFLPLAGMRLSRGAAFAAGCGQLFLARREAYEEVGGHGAVRASRHDGITLPRAFRRAGRSTDLVDATRLASCRMYRSFGELWAGFAKNADEGMGAPGAIVPWTLLLGGGQVLPFVVAPALWLAGSPAALPATGACALSLGTRAVLALRFRQSWLGVLLHPLGVAVVVLIQWYSLARRRAGRPLAWKGRAAG